MNDLIMVLVGFVIFFLCVFSVVDGYRIKALEKEIEIIKKDIVKIINTL